MSEIGQDQIVDAICGATADVFSTMLGVEIAPDAAYTENGTPAPLDGVVALIGLAGSWVGTGMVCCSADFARRICTQLLMSEADSVNEEVLDAVGEVTNMIVGNVKTVLEEIVGPLGLSVPTVVFGHNFTTRCPGTSTWVVVPFHSGAEELTIKFHLAPAGEPSYLRVGHTVAV